jgi:hypothetical protein
MPTEVIKVVDPDNGSGTDYTSLSAWEAGQQQDLVTNDRIATAKCRCTSGSADTAALTIDGWTTNSTHYIKIWTDPSEGYRHNGKWNTQKYRLTVTGAKAISNNIGYVRVFGLQISIDGGQEAFSAPFPIGVTGEIYVGYNIIKATAAGSDTKGIKIFRVSGSVYIYNNIIYDIKQTAATSAGIEIYGVTSAPVYNNTVVDCYYGLWSELGTVILAKNNIVKGSGDVNAYVGTFVSGTDYNATDGTDDIGTGTHNRTSQTFTFVDEVNDDFHLASTDSGARDHGVDLSSDPTFAFSDDIDGQTRSGTWDIGADEYVASGLSINIYDSTGVTESLD